MNRRTDLTQVRLGLLALILFLFSASCSVSNPDSLETDDGSAALIFNGIDRIESQKEGAWKVIWSPLLGAGNATYLVFERREEGEPFDLEEPVVRTQQNYFTSKDLRLVGSTCYFIKALVGNSEIAGPIEEVCTGHAVFKFGGLSEIVPLSSGNYLLKWEKSPFSPGEMTFEVKERLNKVAFFSQAGRTAENFFSTRKIGIDETVCFAVKYVHSSLPKDANTSELCTDAETSGNFTGIKDVQKAGDEGGGYIVSWEPSARGDIAGYQILNGNDMKTVIGEVPADRSQFRVKGLGVGAAYSFAVRFFTKNGRVDSNIKKISIIALNDKPIVTKVTAEGVQNINSYGVNVTEKIRCNAEFVDPDKSLGRLYPKFVFKARLSEGERPIVVREEMSLGPVDLDVTGKGTVSAEYKVDESKDRKGNNLFCTVVVFDGMDKSDAVSSSYLGLPDNDGVSTGLYISKKVFYNPESGSSHYYDDKSANGPGGGAGELGHECMMIDARTGASVPKNDTLDICEDTTVEVIIKRLAIPDELLLPEKAFELQGFRDQRKYRTGVFSESYKTFYSGAESKLHVGYFDPDRSDNAIAIEIRSEKNGKVIDTRCLEGVCIVKFDVAPDYFSGFPFGEKDDAGNVYPHAHFEYRVRTYDPGETEGTDVNGTLFVDVGWTNWAPVFIEVTGVDEKPRSTGVTVKGLEDRVQKIIICNDKNDDPECEKDKAIGFEFDSVSGVAQTLDGFGFGYSDPEADPAIAFLARDEGSNADGWWVKPVVENPRLENRYDWVKIGAYSTMVDLAAACDPVAEFCPFKCNQAEKKCVAYFMPPEDKDTSAFVFYDVVVEVDTTINLDPAYVGKPPELRRVQTKNTGVLTVEFAPVNDAPDTGTVNATDWQEDQDYSHVLYFSPKTSYLTDPYAVPRDVANFPATDVRYYDPDTGERFYSAGDIEMRWLEGGVYKSAYCKSPLDKERPSADFPGNNLSAPDAMEIPSSRTTCQLTTGPVSYIPRPTDAIFSSKAGQMVSTYAEATVVCFGAGSCEVGMQYPPDYFGEQIFEYRLRTTAIKDEQYVWRGEEDFSPWRRVSLTVNAVPDDPVVLFSSLAHESSENKTIMEDTTFKLRFGKAYNDKRVENIAEGNRIYYTYFDVDETDDIAEKMTITNIQSKAGVGFVLLNPQTGDPVDVPNDTSFVCTDGICDATFLAAENFFTADNQEAFFEISVTTAPRDPAKRNASTRRTSLSAGKVTFTVSPVDDGPRPGGSGGDGVSIPEDEVTIINIEKDSQEGFGYVDVDENDFAERIEIGFVTLHDTDGTMSPVRDDEGEITEEFYPDGGQEGAPLAVPVSRPFQETQSLSIRGKRTGANSTYGSGLQFVNFSDMNDHFIPETPGDDELPNRHQFTCQKQIENGKPAGTCEFMITPPLDFNTSKFGQAGDPNEIKSHRSARFKFRIFSRDRNRWAADTTTGGQWTPWQSVELYFSPKNDQPVWLTLRNSDMTNHSDESLCGTTMAADPLCQFPPTPNQPNDNGVTNRVKINEDHLGELSFFWRETYHDPADYNTETYTYKKNLENTVGQWQPRNFSFGHTFLGQKMSFEIKSMKTYFEKFNSGRGDPAADYGYEMRWGVPSETHEDIIDGDLKSRLLSHSGEGIWETITGAIKNHFGKSATPAEFKSNVNCGYDGKCWLKMIPASDYFGNIELKTRVADGSSVPSPADWSDSDMSPTLQLEVSNVDDLPRTQDFVFDLFEDESVIFRFGRLPNTGVCGGAFGSMKKDPDCFGICPMVWTMPRDNPNLDLRATFAVHPNGCQAPNNEDLNVYRVYSYEDVDREDVRVHEVGAISQPANITVAPVTNSIATGGWDALRFDLSTARDFNNATYQPQANPSDLSQPFLYGAGQTAKGDLTVDWRLKTSTSCVGGGDCFSKDKSGADYSKIYARVLPVDDPPIITVAGATVRSVAFRTINEGKLAASAGSGKEPLTVFSSFNAIENKPFTISISDTQYVDRDGHAAPFNRAAGIRQCQAYQPPGSGLFPPPPIPIADNYMFKWGKPIQYNEILKNAFDLLRVDPFSNMNSFLRQGAGSMSSGFLNPTVVSARNKLYDNENPEKHGLELLSNCPMTGGVPTGTCSIELQPPRNVNGEFLLCLEIRSFAKLGDFIRGSQDRWARSYFKVTIENVDNPPRISQLPVRARANEDHDMDVEIGPWPFSWLYWEIPRPDDAALAVRPGYWDYDQSNGQVNPAESVVVNLRGDGIVYGSKGGTLRFDSTPDNGVLTYDGSCSETDDGNDANDLCAIPCKANGFCNFQFNPPEHFNGRVKLKYWVRSKPSDGNSLNLSSRKIDNTRALNGNNPVYQLYEQEEEYENIPEMMQCADKTLIDLDNWRFNTESAMAGNYNQTLWPVTVPTYPQLNPPLLTRVLPQLFGRDNSRMFIFVPLKPDEPNISLTESMVAQSCSINDAGDFVCSYPFPPDDCGSLEEGDLILDIHPVPDKPFPTLPVRQFVTSQPVEQNEIILGIKATSGEDGYQDGDGDGLKKILWRYKPTDPDPVIAYGSLTTDPNPPELANGLTTLAIDAASQYYMIGGAANSAAPGCDLATKKCRFYFHPRASLTTTSLNLRYSVETGVDSWRSDEDSIGTLKIEVFNETPTIVADLAGGPFHITEDSVNAVLRKNNNSTVDFVVDEGGTAKENFQQIGVTFSSSNTLVIPNSGITLSVADGPATDFGSLIGNVLITPLPDRLSATPITITMRASEPGAGGLFAEASFAVIVDPVNDSPQVLSANPLAAYSTPEDTALVISDVRLDEGGGVDEDSEVVIVSFTTSDQTVIPNGNVVFSKSDNASDFGASAGIITVTPAANRNSTTPVTVTMTLSDGTSAPNLVRTFDVTVTPVNDAPYVMAGSPPSGSYAGGLNTLLEIINVQIDEGGIAVGTGNEDSQSLSVTFGSSNAAVIPVANISIDGADGSGDSSILKRTVRILPVAKSATVVTITMTISDGSLSGVRTFGVTVADPPVGSISCTPAGGNLTFGVGQPVSITCSGAAPPSSQTLAYVLKDNCGGAMSIGSSSGIVTGVMPASNCQVWVTATSNGVELDPSGQRKLDLLAAKVTSVGAQSPTINHSCRVTLQANTVYSNCGYASSILTPGAGFSSPQSSAGEFSAVVTDFAQSSVSWGLSVTGSEGTTTTGTASFTLTGATLSSLAARSPAASITSQTGEGIQAGWLFPPSSCVNASCLSTSPASISAGTNNTCTVSSTGELLCWGGNSNGQLGSGAAPGLTYSSAQNITSLVAPGTALSGVVQVSMGDKHSCALKSNGDLFCAGLNDRGQLGDGSTVLRQTFIKVSSNVSAVSAGRMHTCFLENTGDVYCAGDNTVGQLGNGSDVLALSSSSSFVQVSLGGAAVSLAAGSGHTCALMGSSGSRSLKCWGDNFKDQLGHTALVPLFSSNPVSVDTVDISQMNSAVSIYAGGGHNGMNYFGHTCILTSSGQGHCWGDNSSGQLGENPAQPGDAVRIAAITNVVALAAGEAHTCAINAAGQLYCFGKNDFGQLGLGHASVTPTLTPSLVTFAGVFNAVAAGNLHTCATTSAGSVYCFGRSDEGQVGDSQKGASRYSPVAISGGHVMQSQICKSFSVAP